MASTRHLERGTTTSDDAMEKAEDAADAVEHVADIAEDNEERQGSQDSVGDKPAHAPGTASDSDPVISDIKEKPMLCL